MMHRTIYGGKVMMQQAQTQRRMPESHADLYGSFVDFYEIGMASVRHLTDLNLRSMASFLGQQASVASSYWTDTMRQLAEPRCLQDPHQLLRRQAATLRSCNKRAMDGAIEMTQQTSELLAHSRDELDHMMEEAFEAADKSMHAAQDNVSEISKVGGRPEEKSSETSKAHKQSGR
jgi:hypothetical protein